MNLKQLKAFLVVAQEHQITAAAKLLYTSQPPLSYQMKQLEKELGTSLFIREAHGIELTTAGKAFQNYAQQIVSLANDAKEELDREQKGTLGSIRLGLMSSAGDTLFKFPIQQFTSHYPAVNFQITEDNTYKLIKKLHNNLLDLAIVRTPFNMQGLNKQLLSHDTMVAVYNSDYFKIESPLGIESISQLPLILYRRFEALFNSTFAQSGLHPFYAVKCDDARTAILWAEQGMGVALVPRSIATHYTQHQIVTIDCPSWQTDILAVWKKDRQIKPVVKRLLTAMQ